MAGIGFELRRILKKNTLLSYLEAYGLAAVVGSGPWVLSILALMIIGMISIGRVFPNTLIIQYLVLVTYMMAGSLILSGMFQLLLTRFISDRLFEGKDHKVTPNLLGCMLLVSALGTAIGIAVLANTSLDAAVKMALLCGFVVLCNLWLIIVFLSGMKQYYRIVATLAIGYTLMVLASWLLPPYGILGLLMIFAACQGLITFVLLFFILRNYSAGSLIAFQFLNRKQAFYSLALCGLLYNLGVWVDKFVFWLHPEVSFAVIDMFRASYIYDLPIFIAYLAIIPGMAVFMLHMETDFAASNERFYQTVREGGTLESVYLLKDQMVLHCKDSLYQIFKVQGITLALLLLWSEEILTLLKIDLAYLHLLYVDLVGVSLQVILMAILNVMFYLDKRYQATALVTVMTLANLMLTELSIQLGPEVYGYGFALAMLISTVLGLVMLNRQFNRLEYETFMLQR
ncbi:MULTISPECIES: exopolysaccharide Pel transporter PelG [Pseudoalteromonas]|uniref:exopolysaccharide Pel transporter PelG n=1 Tax=Pseudoalteromonas TaxID=53246 RepID=UPI00110B5820|nr:MULTISPECIES: exopolysaccharide Pel transporter PelG [Pseudoalteromonas]MCG7569646.1 exopolysaccharide Pel transporter PelG [Pseudoalteromonas sp. CNC9-20]TMO49980.1 histidine kinase [Pseudoalteromonas ruthenica]TMO50658.1 histidine kinase [Pseudoalteromonas ruthenica]